MFVPYLKYGCTLEINNARTAAYVGDICAVCDGAKPTLTVDNKCDILNWELDPTDGTTIQPAVYHLKGG